MKPLLSESLSDDPKYRDLINTRDSLIAGETWRTEVRYWQVFDNIARLNLEISEYERTFKDPNFDDSSEDTVEIQNTSACCRAK